MTTSRRAAQPPRRPDPTRAARLHRDAGLERGRSITKGIAFGSVAAVAVAGVYLSQSLPGHAATSGSSTSGTTSPGASAPSDPAASATQSAPSSSTGAGASAGYTAPSGAGVSAPATVPAPTYRPAPVVSGSS
ncbi:MAG TPA: hypothetical protein VIH95_02585 [Acidimicrobiales bacterium]